MHARSSLSRWQRSEAVAFFEQGMGDSVVAGRLNVARDPVKKLFDGWKIHGRNVLVSKPTKAVYSFETKRAIVRRYLAGEPAQKLAAEFKLSRPEQVRQWARLVRREGEEALRPKPKGRPPGAKKEPQTEIERLRQENTRLKAEAAYWKKLRALRDQSEQSLRHRLFLLSKPTIR